MARPSLLHRRNEPAPTPGPAPGTTVLDLFRDNVRVLGDRPALRRRVGDHWEALTWAEYGAAVREVAAGLVGLGVEPGQRVAVLAPNCVEWHIADLAIMCTGAATVPVYHTSASSQVGYILEHSASQACFVDGTDELSKVLLQRDRLPELAHAVLLRPDDGLDSDFLASVEALRAQGRAVLESDPDAVDARVRAIGPDDLATVVYTSGTTGPPKGTLITHGNLMATIRSITAVVDIGPGDRFLSFLPLSHIAERVVSHFGQIVAGGETWFARSLATVAEDLVACRPTVFFAVPRVWEKFHDGIVEALADRPAPVQALARRLIETGSRVVAHEQDGAPLAIGDRLRHRALDVSIGSAIRRQLGLDQARVLVSGAAPIHPHLLRWFHAAGLPVAEVYGQTEDCGPTTLNPPGRIKIGTVGPAIPGVTVRIADDGEIIVRGGNVCPGYLDNEAATNELIDADGWMHSGDLGVLDSDGYLIITGRKKDLIVNAAGKNIAPQSIEVDLRNEPLISHAVVIGDRRPYLVALLTLDAEAGALWAAERGKGLDVEALVEDPDLQAAVADSVRNVNTGRAPVEQIKRWRLLPTELTLAGGELTPTLKVKRDVVAQRYEEVVNELYAR